MSADGLRNDASRMLTVIAEDIRTPQTRSTRRMNQMIGAQATAPSGGLTEGLAM